MEITAYKIQMWVIISVHIWNKLLFLQMLWLIDQLTSIKLFYINIKIWCIYTGRTIVDCKN